MSNVTGRPSGFLGKTCRESVERLMGPHGHTAGDACQWTKSQQQQFCQSVSGPSAIDQILKVESQETCSCSECATTTSVSSSSSSSSSSSTGLSKVTSTAEQANPMKSSYYNYEFCTCDAPLPGAYTPKKQPPKKPKSKGPKAGIWCGSSCCAVAEYFPPKGKSVQRNHLPIKLKSHSSAVPPGTCCFRNDQLIFQMPNKGAKSDSEVLPFYNVGADEKPLGVKMIRPEENPEMDPDNNTYLLKITKTDPKGKQAKLQLALKIPRLPDGSVNETERKVQYDAEDLREPSMRRKSRKSKQKSKGSTTSRRKHTATRFSRRSTKTKRSTMKSSTNKVKFSGLKGLVKGMKKKA